MHHTCLSPPTLILLERSPWCRTLTQGALRHVSKEEHSSQTSILLCASWRPRRRQLLTRSTNDQSSTTDKKWSGSRQCKHTSWFWGQPSCISQPLWSSFFWQGTKDQHWSAKDQNWERHKKQLDSAIWQKVFHCQRSIVNTPIVINLHVWKEDSSVGNEQRATMGVLLSWFKHWHLDVLPWCAINFSLQLDVMPGTQSARKLDPGFNIFFNAQKPTTLMH